jgi:hypothetical protein
VSPRDQVLLAEERVVLDVDLGVERDHLPVGRDDERVHLDQAGITLEV